MRTPHTDQNPDIIFSIEPGKRPRFYDLEEALSGLAFREMLPHTACNQGLEPVNSYSQAQVYQLNQEARLRQAAETGALTQVRQLLQAGVNPIATDGINGYRTAFQRAVIRNHYDCVMEMTAWLKTEHPPQLRAALSGVDSDGNTVLHQAAEAGFESLVILLALMPECPVNHRNQQGQSALESALYRGNLDTALHLLKLSHETLGPMDAYRIWKWLIEQAAGIRELPEVLRHDPKFRRPLSDRLRAFVEFLARISMTLTLFNAAALIQSPEYMTPGPIGVRNLIRSIVLDEVSSRSGNSHLSRKVS